MDDGAQLIKLAAAVTGVAGLYLVLNGLHLTRKYFNVDQVPTNFISSKVKLRGRLEKVDGDGTIYIQHSPIIGNFNGWNQFFTWKNFTELLNKTLNMSTPEKGESSKENERLERCLKFKLWGISANPLPTQAIYWINERVCGRLVYFQIMEQRNIVNEDKDGIKIKNKETLHSCIIYYKPYQNSILNWYPFYIMLNKRILKLGYATCDNLAIRESIELAHTSCINVSRDDDDIMEAIRSRYDSNYKSSIVDGDKLKKVKHLISPLKSGSANLGFEDRLAIALYSGQGVAQRKAYGIQNKLKKGKKLKKPFLGNPINVIYEWIKGYFKFNPRNFDKLGSLSPSLTNRHDLHSFLYKTFKTMTRNKH